MKVTIDDQIRQAKATLAIEGMEMTPEDEKLIRTKLRGEISHKEFLHEALKLAKLGV
jgi:hypothetical protein